MGIFNLGKKAKKVAAAADPGPAPAPVALPRPADTSVRMAEVEDERKNLKRKGKTATLLSGQLGDTAPAAPVQTSKTILGGY